MYFCIEYDFNDLRTQKFIQHKTQRLSTNASKCFNLQL